MPLPGCLKGKKKNDKVKEIKKSFWSSKCKKGTFFNCPVLIIFKIYLSIYFSIVAKKIITANRHNILERIVLNDIRLVFLIVYVLSSEVNLKFLCRVLPFLSWEFLFNIFIFLRYRIFIGLMAFIVTLSMLPLILLDGKNPIFIDFCI